LGDIEPPTVDILIEEILQRDGTVVGESSPVHGVSRVGDPLVVTVTALDNGVVGFVALEVNQEPVSLVVGEVGRGGLVGKGGTFTLTPTAEGVITFRARARDRNGNTA